MKFKFLIIMTLTTFQIPGMNIPDVDLIISEQKHEIKEDTLYEIEEVDSIPVFNNKIEQNIKVAIQKELVWHIDYPQEAIEKDIYGKVHLTFVVYGNGKIGSIKVIKGKDILIDNAAIQGISKLNVTRPAIKNNIPVNVIIYYTVTFNTQ